MLLKRLALRNYRVYEDPLELELPGGLIGIYGANGSGKSTLLEAILFALWGKARTAKEDVRTAGVGGDCVAEVTFEHEGHLYEVRRSLSGINLTAKAEVRCDGLAIAEGVRDTGRYLHQILGMDDAAFRASVFAEQKQLAAFSERPPGERRELVLKLLGITPLDAARQTAAKDARELRQSHDRLRDMLVDLDQLRVQVADAEAQADAAKVLADTEEAAAAAAETQSSAAQEAFASLDRVRQDHDGLVRDGRAVREQLTSEATRLSSLQEESAALAEAAAHLEVVLPRSAGLLDAEQRLELVSSVVATETAVAAAEVPPEPPAPDEAALETAADTLARVQAEVAGVRGELAAVEAELSRARDQATRSADLSGGADCPLCGQALGDAFEKVQAHRAAEVREAEVRQAEMTSRLTGANRALVGAKAAHAAQRQEVTRRSDAHQRWQQAAARRTVAEEALARARAALGPLDSAPWARDLLGRDAAATTAPIGALHRALRADVERRREAAREAAGLRGRLVRQTTVHSQLQLVGDRVAELEHRLTVLRDKVRGLGFDAATLTAVEAAAAEARRSAQAATQRATSARLEAAGRAADAAGEARRLADAEAQHAKLATLADDSRHLGRLADLLTSFRNTVVATVGPRLAVQAAELFAELTDHEYDRLEVDPDTYQLQICDGGRTFGLDRFSGSEVDLANLALRVAISEHVRFQSGGTVGLLVLDEVFGPLDQDRKARMLQALERLRGRFRQVLVVTHDSDIKEQLPNAVEVLKLPGRRARARLLEP